MELFFNWRKSAAYTCSVCTKPATTQVDGKPFCWDCASTYRESKQK